ncbi:hypothetical protein C8R48DRAFT_32290 [Suillus tomentosus]|nr:hypothetical protein C8R48DRAFT_32290 [Suillus tomentosus]
MQSCLQYLNRLARLEHRMHEEIQEIRSLFMDILGNLRVTMEDSGGYHGIVDSQAGLNGFNAIPEGFPTFYAPRVTESSSEDVDVRLGLSLGDTIYESAAQLLVPVVQASQVKDKVKCTRDGCSTLVNEDNLARHIDEVHEGKIKARRPGCGRGFKRPDLRKKHMLRTRCGMP